MTAPALTSPALTSPALLLVAHGSRDPRHSATVGALAARVREILPGTRVAVGHLDFDTPSVPDALARLHAAGARAVVAVPLLLTRAFHAKTDIPAVLASAARRLPGTQVHQADVLGPHPLLVAALERRLRQAALTPGHTGQAPGDTSPAPGHTGPAPGDTSPAPGDAQHTGVVLAAAGSSDPEASAVIAEIAREWRHTTGWCAVRPAFASATLPRTADAVRALRADGARRVAVAPYVLAPGRLPDRIAAGAHEAGADVLAPVLGAAPEVARLVAERYADARAGRLRELGRADERRQLVGGSG